MTESDYEDPRFYLGVEVAEQDDVTYCQELTVEWVREVLTKTGGFGKVDPNKIIYDPDNVENRYGLSADDWNNLEFPTWDKLNNSLKKPELVGLVESAFKILMGQTFPIVAELFSMGDDTLQVKKFEKELKTRSEELIKTQERISWEVKC